MIQVEPFVIIGDWDDSPVPSGAIVIRMPPLGHVYGGGWQPTTQNALKAIAEHLKPGMSFLDIGTGSGILAVAAKKLGARRVIATEIDQEALSCARRVFHANAANDIDLVDGTFVNEHVDLAVISISESFANQTLGQIKADKILSVHLDASVEVIWK